MKKRTGSLSHPFKGGFGSWFYSYILGIKPAQPGFKKIIIHPHLIGDLTSVSGFYESVYGRITCEYYQENEEYTLKVTIPVNTTADIYLPATDSKNVYESNQLISENSSEKSPVFSGQKR